MTGDTWRGMIGKKIIEPPSGKDYLTVSGELNSILRNLIDGRFDGLFLVPQVDTGVIIQNFQFDRYCTLLNGIEDLLASVGYRLDIRHKRGEPGIPGWVELQAVPAKMLKKEYNQDNRINFITRDYRRGINHLICAGTGEGTDRTILHLYVQEDGSVGEKQYYKGIHERTALYSYTSQSDIEQLRKDGTKRLQSLANYKEFERLAVLSIPDSKDDPQPVMLDERLLATPAIAVEQTRVLAADMAKLVRKSVQAAIALLGNYSEKGYNEVAKLEKD